MNTFLSQVKNKAKQHSKKQIKKLVVTLSRQEPNQDPISFFGKAIRGPLKVYQSGLRHLQGTGDFKGQIPVSVCIRHQDKVTTAKQQDPAVSSDEMVQTATNTFYSREQEREKGKETRHTQMLAALQGSPMANPETLKDKA